MAVRAYRGMASFYETGLSDAAEQCAAIAPDVAAEFNAAREAASAAVTEFADRIQARRIRPEFAIGSQLYQRMLSVGEAVDTPLSDVLSIGQANLEQNLRRLMRPPRWSLPASPSARPWPWSAPATPPPRA